MSDLDEELQVRLFDQLVDKGICPHCERGALLQWRNLTELRTEYKCEDCDLEFWISDRVLQTCPNSVDSTIQSILWGVVARVLRGEELSMGEVQA